MHVRGSDESDDLDGMSRGTRVLGPARRAVCRRGDDFCNPVVQVYGYRERHGLPLFIVDLLRIYKSRRAAGIRCIIDGYEGVARSTGRSTEQLRPTFAVVIPRMVRGRRRVLCLIICTYVRPAVRNSQSF
jgi:hypothetical protein